MITLHLQGPMATEYGDTLRFEANTPREVVTALAYQCEKYKNLLLEGSWHIFVGRDNDISEHELDLGLGTITDVYLMPKIQGSSGALNFVVGAVLLVAGVMSGFNPQLMAAGVGMMLGGIVQMTTKMPGVQDMSRDSVDEKASFLFSGPTNMASQGVPIPRGYGRMLAGSVVVSAALYAEQVGNFGSTDFPWGNLIVGDKWQ